MKIKPADVHRVVIKRLFLALAGLSVLAGVVAFYLEMRRADRLVLELAVTEIKRFLPHIEELASEQHLAALERQARESLQGDVLLVRIYHNAKTKLLEVSSPGRESVRNTVPAHVHDLRPDNSTHYHMYWADGRFYMQVLLQLKSRGGAPGGYFEGVYEANAATMTDIKTGVASSLALTLGTLLVTAAVLYAIIAALNRDVIKLSSDLVKGNVELMEVLGSAIAMRDWGTAAHNYRVTAYAIHMAEALGFSGAQVRSLIAGAFLHDVGKIGISDTVLLKRGALTSQETAVMRSHVAFGVSIVTKSNWLQSARDVVEFHHERYDGGGYLRRLRGEAIPLNARIFAIVDVFDALTSRRPYKGPLSFDQAMAFLEDGRGTHFDPTLLDVFRSVAGELYGQISRYDDAALRELVRSRVTRYFLEADGDTRV